MTHANNVFELQSFSPHLQNQGTWQLFHQTVFNGGNKWSIFIFNRRFPSSLRSAPHINSSLVFTSPHGHREISSARSFVIISVDGGHSAPVCWSSNSTSDTKKSDCVWARSTTRLAFILLFWHKVLVGRKRICSPAQSVVQQWIRPYKYSSPHP